MLQRPKTSVRTKTIVIAVLAVSLAACSPSPDSQSTDSPASPASSPSPQQTDLSANISIPGVDNVKEINFKAATKNSPNGYFDVVNGSTAPSQEVSSSKPVTVSGWALLPKEGRQADMVIITYGDNNSLVAVAPVNLDRPDIVKLLKNPAYNKSGWSTTFNPSTLPAGKVVLKAWAYNSASKEATQLNPTHEVVVLK
jgi:hypothetical protein